MSNRTVVGRWIGRYKQHVPFQRKRFAWTEPTTGQKVYVPSEGGLPPGSVALGDGHCLDLQTGEVYADARFDKVAFVYGNRCCRLDAYTRWEQRKP